MANKKKQVVEDNPFDEKIMKSEWKSVDWFLNETEPCLNNRDSETRADKEYRKFQKPASSHAQVQVGVYKGVNYRQDGNTRHFIYANQNVPKFRNVPIPPKVLVTTRFYSDKETLLKDYYYFDNQTATETKPDILYGIFRELGKVKDLNYFTKFRGFSGLPIALEEAYFQATGQTTTYGKIESLQLQAEYFSDEFVLFDKLATNYMNDKCDGTTKNPNAGGTGMFQMLPLQNVPARAQIIVSCLAFLKKYSASSKIKKAQQVITDLLYRNAPDSMVEGVFGHQSKHEGKVMDPIDVIASEWSKESAIFWPNKATTGTTEKNPFDSKPSSFSNRISFILFLLEAAYYKKKVNPKTFMIPMKDFEKQFAKKELNSSKPCDKRAISAYRALFDRRAGWNTDKLSQSVFAFCNSATASKYAKEMYE